MTAPALKQNAQNTTHAPAVPASSAQPSFAFSIPRSALVDALTRIQTDTGKATLPIVQSVLVDADRDGVSFAMTDLEQWVTTRLPGGVTGSGRAALPAKRFREIVSNLPQGVTVTVTVQGMKAKIQAGRARFDLIGLPTDEWPDAPTFTPALEADVDGPAFVASLKRIQALAADQGDMTLQSALLDATTDGLFLACFDRNAGARAVLAESSTFTTRAILPRQAFGPIARLFGGEETIRIRATERQCQLVGSGTTASTLTFRLMEGPYPPYNLLLAAQPTLSITVARAELADAVKRVAVVADMTNAIVLRFKASEIALYCSTDLGTANDVVAAQRTIHDPAGEHHTARLNARILVDVLGAVVADEVVIQFRAPDKPILFRDAKAPDSKAVAMMAGFRLQPGDTGDSTTPDHANQAEG